MEIGEMVAVVFLESSFEEKCPFKEQALGVDAVEGESIFKDDTKEAEREQTNDGGTLGRNLQSGLQGAANTIGGPLTLKKTKGVERVDTLRTGISVRVASTYEIDAGDFGFSVAAHHLIPGEASLEASNLKHFMTRGESVEVETEQGVKTKEIAKHIGYNVNGAHNGVWLPGNYYIREDTSPRSGVSWGGLGDDPWCLNYVAAVTKAANGQIHDAHTAYSGAVKRLLNDIAEILARHECDECASDKINPPFQIKERLYNLSSYLRGQVTGLPVAWKRPWFTSDRWRDTAFSGGKPSRAFADAYDAAKIVTPGR
jgi:hypothetical protein